MKRKVLEVTGLVILLLASMLAVNNVKNFKIEELQEEAVHAVNVENTVQEAIQEPLVQQDVQILPEQPIMQPELPIEPEPVVYEEPVPAIAPISDNDAKNFIYMQESSMRLDAVNADGCYGLGQSCGSGLKDQCPDWYKNYECQDAYWDSYAHNHCDYHLGYAICYNGWQGAYEFWLQYNYW